MGYFIEAPYLKNLLQGLEYDTIYHEHLTYLSIKPLRELFQKFDLEIFDVEFKDFHGGSIRVFVQHKNSCYEISNKILEIERDEEMLNIHNINKLENFAKSVEEHKRKLIETLKTLKEMAKK